MTTRESSAVIPAKAGIHFVLLFRTESHNTIKLDPGFRWDDNMEYSS